MHQFSEEQLKIVTEELGCNYIYTSAKCNKYVSEAFEAICKMAIECRNERIEISRQLRGRNKNVGCKCSIMWNIIFMWEEKRKKFNTDRQ